MSQHLDCFTVFPPCTCNPPASQVSIIFRGLKLPALQDPFRRTRRNHISARRRRIYGKQSPAVSALAFSTSDFQQVGVPNTVLSDFLELGVCRELYFGEISLRDQLAAEARLVAQALESASKNEQDQSGCPEVIQKSSEWEQAILLAERALKANVDGQHLDKLNNTKNSQRSNKAPLPTPLSTEQLVANRNETRRKLRRDAWYNYAMAGAAAGIEPGALDIAMKRRLLHSRALPRQSSSSSQHLDASLRHSHPILRAQQLAGGPGKATSGEGASRTALNMLLGSQTQRLNREQELELVKDMQQGLAVQAVIDKLWADAQQPPSLQELADSLGQSPEEISAILRAGSQAKHALVHCHKRLVFKVAHKFGFDSRIPLEEYVLAGMEGLVEGLLKFDQSRGYRPSSMLIWWIRNRVTVLATSLNQIVPIPRSLQYAIPKLRASRLNLVSLLGRQPTDAELAEEAKMSAGLVAKLLVLEKHSERMLSDPITGLAKHAEEDGGAELSSLVRARGAEPVMRQRAVADSLERALAGLKPRDARIIRSLYGIGHRAAKSKRQVAQEQGLCTERVSQIRSKFLAMARERHWDEVYQAAAISA